VKFAWKAGKGILFSAPLLLLTGCGQTIQVLHPQGPVARQEYHLILYSFGVMAIVVLIVFVLFAFMLVKYRARPGNENITPPEIEGNTKLEMIWTVIPILIVVALAIPTVRTTFALEKPPVTKSYTKPIVIDVTSADWKWIFSYPEQGIETVNYVDIPAGVPIQFELTAIGPMNSFWVPELGGQEYSMPGMSSGLWLEADHSGDYLGRSANFSGAGFAHMTFHVISKPQADFNAWVSHVKQTAPKLTSVDYEKLLKPGLTSRETYSSNVNPVVDEMDMSKLSS